MLVRFFFLNTSLYKFIQIDMMTKTSFALQMFMVHQVLIYYEIARLEILFNI